MLWRAVQSWSLVNNHGWIGGLAACQPNTQLTHFPMNTGSYRPIQPILSQFRDEMGMHGISTAW